MYVQYTAAKAYINKSALLKITILDYMYLFLNGGIFRQRKPILEKGKKTCHLSCKFSIYHEVVMLQFLYLPPPVN